MSPASPNTSFPSSLFFSIAVLIIVTLAVDKLILPAAVAATTVVVGVCLVVRRLVEHDARYHQHAARLCGSLSFSLYRSARQRILTARRGETD